jgi:hypothetical protein
LLLIIDATGTLLINKGLGLPSPAFPSSLAGAAVNEPFGMLQRLK